MIMVERTNKEYKLSQNSLNETFDKVVICLIEICDELYVNLQETELV